MSKENVAIIGGSGVYAIFQDRVQTQHEIETPFGKVNYSKIVDDSRHIYFLARHGQSHIIPPHKINFKANIYALFLLGVKKIIGTNAVGSLKYEIEPGHFVIVDQFIDLVSGPITFFDGNFKIVIEKKVKSGVVHTDVTSPYSESIRSALIEAMGFFPNEKFHAKGVYIRFNGPRFETSAEISMFKQFGDVVGMTGTPEVILARELSMDYASLNIVTNYAAGLQKTISQSDVMELFNQKAEIVQKIIQKSLELL